MSPKESWLRLAQMGPVHMEKREGLGTHLRDTDAADPDYHGIPITHNVPVLGSPTRVGQHVLGFTLN